MALFVLSFVNWILFSLFALLLWYRNIKADRIYASLLFFLAIVSLAIHGHASGLPKHTFYLFSIFAIALAVIAASITTYFKVKNYYALLPCFIALVFLAISLTKEVNINLSFTILLILFAAVASFFNSSFIILSLFLLAFIFLSSKIENYMAYISMFIAVLGWVQGESLHFNNLCV